jgi:hypothetical protein
MTVAPMTAAERLVILRMGCSSRNGVVVLSGDAAGSSRFGALGNWCRRNPVERSGAATKMADFGMLGDSASACLFGTLGQRARAEGPTPQE